MVVVHTRRRGDARFSADITPFAAKAVSRLNELCCFQPVHPAMLADGSQLSGWFPLTDVNFSDTAPPVTL